MSTMREQFEAWAAEEGYPESSFEISNDGDVRTYYDTTTEAMWDSWQAATEAAKATGTAGALIVPDPQPTEGYKTDFNKGYSQGFNACREKLLENCASNCTTLDTCRNYGCAEAARQLAPVVAVKTWQERMNSMHSEDGHYGYVQMIQARDAEIADLRAALTARSQP